ncbi:hypothetical protein EXN66_Car021406 [Channa argus]|uniref:Uncharacterized protein n=1 Tax=Channa argus TaxID=215402 RepID=A0A6G1QT38_CHAAH|nr:hypothetical protein EXN66_Car021406 [Channa argus]
MFFYWAKCKCLFLTDKKQLLSNKSLSIHSALLSLAVHFTEDRRNSKFSVFKSMTNISARYSKFH